jgi:hypothetical protein
MPLQWSPPVTGMNARASWHAGHHRHRTAMEPAAERRSMPVQIVLEDDTKEPQWSPPMIGGMTNVQRDRGTALDLAAMMRPVTGGNTPTVTIPGYWKG